MAILSCLIFKLFWTLCIEIQRRDGRGKMKGGYLNGPRSYCVESATGFDYIVDEAEK